MAVQLQQRQGRLVLDQRHVHARGGGLLFFRLAEIRFADEASLQRGQAGLDARTRGVGQEAPLLAGDHGLQEMLAAAGEVPDGIAGGRIPRGGAPKIRLAAGFQRGHLAILELQVRADPEHGVADAPGIAGLPRLHAP